MEESQGKAAQAHLPEQVRKYSENHGMHKRIHAGMAELLQHGRHEKEHRRTEWMGVQKDTDVYLKTVETAEDPKTEADRSWNAGMGSM